MNIINIQAIDMFTGIMVREWMAVEATFTTGIDVMGSKISEKGVTVVSIDDETIHTVEEFDTPDGFRIIFG